MTIPPAAEDARWLDASGRIDQNQPRPGDLTMMICKKALNAIKLPCPKCGEAETEISLQLFGLDDDDAQFRCNNCENEFGRNEIAEFIRRWSKVLAWMDLAPDMDAE